MGSTDSSYHARTVGYLFVLVACVVAVMFAAEGCRRSPPVACVDFEAGPVTVLPLPVLFCPPRGLQGSGEPYRILLDASGSMAGFRAEVPRILRWLDHGASRLRAQAASIGPTEVMFFSGTRGITQPVNVGAASAAFEASGDTNLHEAIESAAGHSVTVVVTDGVAFLGGPGTGDCAAGVDPACVARSMRAAVGSGRTGATSDRGLWLVPVLAEFDGVFPTEEYLPVADFDSGRAIEGIRLRHGREVSIRDTASDSQGRLYYRYSGPKLLVALVIGEPLALGRAVAASLLEAAGGAGIRLWAAAGEPPEAVELYPGLLEGLSWSGATIEEALDVNGEPSYGSCGTMDVVPAFEAGSTAISVTCQASTEAEGVYRLALPRQQVTQRSGCQPIQSIAPFRLEMVPERLRDQTSFDQMIRGLRPASGESRALGSADGLAIDLHLRCDGAAVEAAQIGVQWVAFADYQEAADSLTAGPQGAAAVVSDASTAEPSYNPDKVYGLAETIELFLQASADDQRRLTLGHVNLRVGAGR